MLRVLGIFGILIGLGLLVTTVTGVAFHDQPWKGYLYGTLIAVFGAIRFMRGVNGR